MTGFSFAPTETNLEFRTTPRPRGGERETYPAAWRGIELAPRTHAPAPPPYDPAALHEEGDRWDGLS